MEATAPQSNRNDVDGRDGDPRESESSVSERSVERHSQDSSQNFPIVIDTSDDV